VGVVLIVALMFLTVVHSLGRYGFNTPVPGLAETSSFMLIAASFLVIPHTQVLKGHISIGLLIDRLSPRKQAIFDSFTYIICLITAAVALWRTAVEANHMMQGGYESQILGIPEFPFMGFMSFGWGLLALTILLHLIHFIVKAVRS
jgi:TRAP-type C4-dicarboxylate transport system permease small subunit